jgi:hypothetical protein
MPAEARRTASVFQTIVTRLRERWAGAGRAAVKDQGPEAARVETTLDLHEPGVRLYRQRMHREHPQANRREIDSMVRAWLAEPSRGGHLCSSLL